MEGGREGRSKGAKKAREGGVREGGRERGMEAGREGRSKGARKQGKEE